MGCDGAAPRSREVGVFWQVLNPQAGQGSGPAEGLSARSFSNDRGLTLKGWEVCKRYIMGAWQYQQRDREAPTGTTGSEAKTEDQESETLRARIATEMRMVEKLHRIVRPLALIIFALLGVVVGLQLYTWMRLEQLTTLGRQREERMMAAQAAMQAAIGKQRPPLERTVQQMVSPGHANPKVNLVGEESGGGGSASAAHAQPKLAKASKGPKPEHRAAPRPGTGQPVPEQSRPAVARQTSPEEASATRQDSRITYQTSATNRLDLSDNRQRTSPPPTSQGPSAQQSVDAIQNEQHEGAETSSMRLSQSDTVVARDHNEIERLRKLGKRDYVEFTLVRSGTRQEVVPDISLELRKVDSKRLRCALSIYAEDYEFPADLSINKPVVFPIRAMWESVELVINKMGKDTVVGYLSARKGVLAVGR